MKDRFQFGSESFRPALFKQFTQVDLAVQVALEDFQSEGMWNRQQVHPVLSQGWFTETPGQTRFGKWELFALYFLCCQKPSQTGLQHVKISHKNFFFFPALWLGPCFDVCFARDAIVFAFCLLLLQWAISHPCHLQRGKDRMETEQRARNKRKAGIFPKAHLMYKYKQEKDAWGGRRQELQRQTAVSLWREQHLGILAGK